MYVGNEMCLPVTAPPPCYQDAAPKSSNPKFEYSDAPPGYDEAVAMMRPLAPPLEDEMTGPHLRKKSLTPMV